MGRIEELEKALREILEAGTEEALKEDGSNYPWDKYLLYHTDVSRYWSLLQGETTQHVYKCAGQSETGEHLIGCPTGTVTEGDKS